MSILHKLEIDKHGTSKQFVILLHAYTSDPSSLRYARKIIEKSFPNADLMVPELPFKNAFSLAKPAQIIAELLIAIDKAWQDRKEDGSGGYDTILMVGHCIGALYARKLYVCACGETAKAPFEPDLKIFLEKKGGISLSDPREWAVNVDRIILLAGMNRGWSISHHLFTLNAIQWAMGTALGITMMALRLGTPTIYTVRQGETFITQLRIQWLAMRRKAKQSVSKMGKLITQKQIGCANVIQLLGSIDDLVSPNDNIDLIVGNDFIFFDVPESDHTNIIHMDESNVVGYKRAKIFSDALNRPFQELSLLQVFPSDSSLIEKPEVTDVVFVVHGIRDKGYWTQKIARQVISEGRKLGRVFASKTSTYGYFPMFSFLWPSRRRQKVQWLMDQYAEALAKYPNAEAFHYIGHSNGTYLAARALEEYPCCRFKHIAFAGSVVNKNYKWSRFIPTQVGAVANYIATTDWVVALFPKAFQTLHLQDLGSAGHDGFLDPLVLQLSEANKPQFIVGKHDAALKEQMWKSIANFILTGKLTCTQEMKIDKLISDKQPFWLRIFSTIAPLIWLGIVLMLYMGAKFVSLLPFAEWERTLIIVGYVFILWTILTKV
jgi:hypothetical protein